MQTIHARGKTGKDGTLSLSIPLGQPDAEFDVTVVVRPAPLAAGGWPEGYFDHTFGSITDNTFERPPQGDLPRPPVLD